jgi:cellulose biosynthesis protein BcsQ
VCDLLPAGDELAEAEQRAQARWLVQSLTTRAGENGQNGHGAEPGPDARFLFRQAFHASPLLDRYDYVLFDCPPRLTTTAVNALACSDFLLIPALLDQLSVDALPRTLAHLDRLAHLSQARLLGVVGNRARLRGDNVIVRQRGSYDGLLNGVRLSKYTRSEPFRVMVKDSSEIGEAANEGSIAAAEEEGMELFNDLADAVESGVKSAMPEEMQVGRSQ